MRCGGARTRHAIVPRLDAAADHDEEYRLAELVTRFSGVVKRYGASAVLRAVDVAIERGEFLGLAGVNGAGKTTLIKCMLDFCALDAGRIELFGLPHTDPRARARVAFLPERFVPPYYLTGRDFLGFMLALQERPYVGPEVQTMLEALDLDPGALAKPVRAYSKGIDEPMSGLDPKARACVKALLARLKAEGATLFFTSHALADVEEICDRMVVLHQGVPYYSGPPRALCDHYGETSMERAFLRCIAAR
jgi:ABC-2 type transport system ATP-binding protein